MNNEQYISVRETAQILGITEKKVMDLIEQGGLQGYRIANQFLRLKKSEITNLRNTGQIAKEITEIPYTRQEKIRDFFYYNDFYLVSLVIISGLIYIVLFR